MNSLKPLVMLVVLGSIGYVVYTRLNSKPPTPPPGAPTAWEGAPAVQMGDAGAPAWPQNPSGSPWSPPSAPGGNAPSFNGTPSGPDAASAGPPTGLSSSASAPPWTGGSAAPGGEAPPFGQSHSYGAAAQDGSLGAAASVGTPTGPSLGAPSGSAPPASDFALVMESARRDLDGGRLAETLRQLSAYYDDPKLSASEQQQLSELLDQVAGTVVYSTQHLLEPPYDVQPGEKLDDIAAKYQVPSQLLAKINGIDDPQNLRAGEQLKVIRGPFSAVVNVEKRQLTLMLGGAYAGRFALGFGRDHMVQEGEFVVTDKVVNPTYHGSNRAIDGGDASNPLGGRWIGLGEQMGIHGMSEPNDLSRSDLPGCMNLGPRDVEDVYDILSIGSKVVIRR